MGEDVTNGNGQGTETAAFPELALGRVTPTLAQRCLDAINLVIEAGKGTVVVEVTSGQVVFVRPTPSYKVNLDE